MHEPLYRDALRASWRLAWHHKNIWPFGLFALLLGQFGFLEIITKVWAVKNQVLQNTWVVGQQMFSYDSWLQIKTMMAGSVGNWIWLVWLTIILPGLFLSLVFVSTVCQGALVYIGAKYAKVKIRFPSEQTAWHMGVRHFWRVFTLNMARKFIVWTSAFALAELAIFLAIEQTWWLWVGFVGALLLGMIVSIITMYATGYAVVEEYTFPASFNAGARLFLKHPLVSLEVGIITLLLNGSLMIFGLLALLYVFFLPNLLAQYVVLLIPIPLFGQVVAMLSYALFLAISLAAGALFAVFSTSVWAYLFSRMHHGKVTSTVLRLLSRK